VYVALYEYDTRRTILISGEELRGYTAASDLTRGEPVGISGDYEVDSSGAGEGDFIGVVLHDVTAGEEVPIGGDDCEVRIPVSEAVTAGEELLPDGAGEFESVATSAGSTGVAIVNAGAGAGEFAEAYLSNQGATA